MNPERKCALFAHFPASGEPIKKRLRSSAAEKASCDYNEGASSQSAAAPSQPCKSPTRSKAKQLRRSQRQRNPSSSNAATVAAASAVAGASAAAAGRNEADDEDDGAAAVRGAMRVGTRNMSHKEWDETNVDCYCPNRDIECFKVKVL